MRRLLLILLLLAALALARRRARLARARSSPSRRRASCCRRPRATRRSTRSPRFGVTHVRQLVYWRDYAPEPGQQDASRRFDARDPDAYPADKWDNLDGADRRGQGARHAGHADAHRPGAALGDARAKKDNLTDPDPKEFGAFATAIGRRYGDRRRARGRSGTSPTSRSSSSRSTGTASRTRRSSTASSTRPPTRACARRRPTPTTRS